MKMLAGPDMIGAIIYKSPMFARWVAWLGWIASAVYLLAQTEPFATAIPDFRVIGWAGLYGGLLWLLWMIVIGVYLIKNKAESAKPEAHWGMSKAMCEVGTFERRKAISRTKLREGLRR